MMFAFLVILLLIGTSMQAQYYTHPTDANLKTLRVCYADGERAERPYLVLGEDRSIEVSFDELSHNAHQYTYTVVHCNSDWTESDLSTQEYLQGFTTADITDYDYSINTQQLYTHYRFLFPNEDMRLTASGNYAIRIYEDGDTDKTVGWVCLSVVEPQVTIEASVRTNTDIELSGRYQQLDIDILTEDLRIVDSQSEIRLVVQQNGRRDNQVSLTRPTFIDGKRLRYINRRELIFEAGNEYRHFDIASQYFKGNNVDYIHFDHNYYQAFLFPDDLRTEGSYINEYDANGQYQIHAERAEDSDYEADYMWVHFLLPTPQIWLDGSVYVGGELTYNSLTQDNRMTFDAEHNVYTLSLYVKQGGYDYQYWFAKRQSPATLFRTEGSYWQTRNEYTVFVYYRPFGSRADRLVGIKRL